MNTILRLCTNVRDGRFCVFSCIVAPTRTSIQQVDAHEGATGIVKERMQAMKILRDHAKVVGDMLKGKTDLDIEAIRTAAEAFFTQGQQISALFPDTEASRHGRMSEALPAILQAWDAFRAFHRGQPPSCRCH